MAAPAMHRCSVHLLRRISSTSSSPSAVNPVSLSSVKAAIRSESNPDRIADLFDSAVHLPGFRGDIPIYRLTVRKLSRARRPDLVDRLLVRHLTDPSLPKSEGFLLRLISLYANAGMIDRAVSVFDAMPSVGCPYSERSLACLLTAFLKIHRHDELVEAFGDVPKSLNIAPGIVCYNILLKSHCSKGDMEAARKVFDEMPDKGVVPDIISYNTLLYGLLKKGEEAAFHAVVKEISSKGGSLKPNVVTYNCRITYLCGKGKVFEAEELLDIMLSKGVFPNSDSFNTIIQGLCKDGQVGKALKVYWRMKAMKRTDGSDGAAPSSDTYIQLLLGLVQKGELDSALGIYKECLSKHWAPPFSIVKRLIDGLKGTSQLDEAKQVLGGMRKVVKGDALDAWKKIRASITL